MREKRKTNFSLFKWLLHNSFLWKLMIKGKAFAKILPFQLELLFQGNQAQEMRESFTVAKKRKN